MTEHHKAVKNRKRDFEAHHEHVHNYDPQAIAGGLLLVNAASTFQSPLKTEVTKHNNPTALVAHCVREMANVAVKGGPAGYGLEAKCVLVISMNNEDLEETHYVSAPPAPQVGDPMHYDAFIQRICAIYTNRFP